MIYVKMHATEQGKLLAMCDESLIDSVLSDKKSEINIKAYADFYKGKLMNADQAAAAAEENGIYSINVVGKQAVDIASKAALIEKQNVRKIKNVPYAQAYRLDY